MMGLWQSAQHSENNWQESECKNKSSHPLWFFCMGWLDLIHENTKNGRMKE
jgi:hypothetical protein